jgi:hypothetical protein
MSTGKFDDSKSTAERMEAIRGAKGSWLYGVVLAGILTGITVFALVEAARQDESRFVGMAVVFVFPALVVWAIVWRTAGVVWKK